MCVYQHLYIQFRKYAIFAVGDVLLNCSVHFLDVVVRISRVEKVNAHQFDVLVVYHDRCSDGLLGVDMFCRRFLFSMIPTPCLLSYFPVP